MKRILLFALAAVMVLTSFTGCSKFTKKSQSGSGKQYKIALVLSGTLGDKSFMDSANNGLNEIKKKYNAKTKVFEMGSDTTKYEPTIEDVSNGDWNIIIASSFQLQEAVQDVAPKHKDKKYILYDASVDYDKGDYSNVYSINYKQNESSFLAGVLAAKTTQSSMSHANKNNVIGFVGGMNNPTINDFLVGYIQGAKYADSNVKIAISFVGSFSDTTKGKEMALSEYNQNVDVIFSAAGSAGLGTIDAAKQMQRYAIGVDSDQSMLFKDSDSEKANLILSSAMKRVDNSLLLTMKAIDNGSIKWGTAVTMGIKDNAVGLADNEFYQKNVPSDIRKAVTDAQNKINSGDIKVDTAIGMSSSKLNELINSVKP